MDTMLLTMLQFLVVLLFIIYCRWRVLYCPDCRAPLPLFVNPLKKTRRMWRSGGYLCARCGCETNAAGEKVTADTPLAPVPVLQWAMLAVLLLGGVGLGLCLMLTRSVSAAPPVQAAPLQAPSAGAADSR